MLLHTENVDNVDNFVNNSVILAFLAPKNVDNFVGIWWEAWDNLPTTYQHPTIFVNNCQCPFLLYPSLQNILTDNFRKFLKIQNSNQRKKGTNHL